MEAKNKQKYYSLKNILSKNALYNVIYGERSNGKTFAVLELIIQKFIDSNEQEQGVIIRRWEEDFRGKNGSQQFDNFIYNSTRGNIIEKMTKGKYNYVVYNSRRWYLANYIQDENGKGERIVCEKPFCIGLNLTADEHYKSLAFPQVTTILFDEFITRKLYLPDEFITFQSILSTIIRDRDNVTIFMCGNSINKYCPHFKEMGLKHIPQMKQGDIDVYDYGDSGLRVAVEYSDSPSKKGKKSDKYFAFDNPKLKMITSGAWEIGLYPHLPKKYKPKDIRYTYFILFEDELLQCEIIQIDRESFTFIHRKTTPIKEDNKGLVYQQTPSIKNNYRVKINNVTNKLEKLIYSYFINDKVFYQDNETGEVVRNYLNWCRTN